MSGFAGVVRVDLKGSPPEADREVAAQLAQAIAFRGPDGTNVQDLPGACFAFSFCKTGPSPQEPTLPVTLDGDVWLIGDVRCDGRPELFAKLDQHKVAPSQTASSEQLLLTYFSKFGEVGLPEIAGDLSLAVWHQRERKLVAFRDLTGARPFFYTVHDEALVFSNTLQALLVVPRLARDLDEQFLGDFLLESPYFDQTRTVYKQIRRLPPGHLLEYSSRGLSTRRIANMPVEEPLQLSGAEEYQEEFRRLLAQAVSDRLPDSAATILLSGGLDSTTLAACAAKLRKGSDSHSELRLRAYTVDSQPLYEDDETRLASALAAKLGMPCDVVHSGHVLPFSSGDGCQPYLPEPAIDPYALLYNFYHREIAKSSRVAFSGGGGDEVLRIRALPYLQYLRKTKGLLAPVWAITKFLVKYRKLPPLGTGVRTRFRGLIGYQPDVTSFPPWLNNDFSRRLNLPERWQAIEAAPTPRHPWNPLAYASVNNGSVAGVLETYDPYWTRCLLEVRSPFMDRRLTRFLVRVPTLPWAADKQLLRSSQRNVLPDEILNRKKSPLQGDDVVLHISAKDWSPVPSEPPPEFLRTLVDWKLLIECLTNNNSDLHLHLRPIALAYWLKSIENNGGFQ